MSPRAAWRLETLGLAEVYEYKVGKLDWLAAGLPTEGTNAEKPRAGAIARKNVPTCHLDERLSRCRTARNARAGMSQWWSTRSGWSLVCCGQRARRGQRAAGLPGDAAWAEHGPALRSGRRDGQDHGRPQAGDRGDHHLP